eukprot:TRINITY_DN121974_c0_g1_i1.p1 TRINITY_DN121974_c0_g1~~TRINITY_DN121974_c0_g1_i1.p1  ORF type:complete len:456 (-),score=78.01 TRINITY_DN121974_c0_g1_i1:185-1552(-)
MDGAGYDGPDDEPGIAATFQKDTWNPSEQMYGMSGLLKLLTLMRPIEKPQEVSHMKFLIVPGGAPQAALEEERPDAAAGSRARRTEERGGRQGKGGRDRDGKGNSGRFVPDMGHTEVVPGRDRGQWWRNRWTQDVLARNQCSIESEVCAKIPPRHYVLQNGPLEVFVDGAAKGMQRMPIQPRGWVTVDATHVNGPKYLEPVAYARWKVIFSSGMPKGDIVVRETVKLESTQVAVLFCNSFVDQAGPCETLEDGIVRMPIQFVDGSRRKYGWVTLDASPQGGPVFFEPAAEQDEQPEKKPMMERPPAPAAKPEKERPPREARQPRGEEDEFSWDKNRIWSVVNIGPADGVLAVVKSAEPFAPGSGRTPSDDKVVKWLKDGDIVEQVGHSKKMKGYMIMPVRILEAGQQQPTLDKGGDPDGWVTRRLVDKQKQNEAGTWFKELEASERRQARATRNR